MRCTTTTELPTVCSHKYELKYEFMDAKVAVPYMRCRFCQLIQWVDIPTHIPREQWQRYAIEKQNLIINAINNEEAHLQDQQYEL